jgi:hypothetical protein
MRELFDDIEGKLSPDPREASQKSSRTPLRKKFYTSAGVAEGRTVSGSRSTASRSARPARIYSLRRRAIWPKPLQRSGMRRARTSIRCRCR